MTHSPKKRKQKDNPDPYEASVMALDARADAIDDLQKWITKTPHVVGYFDIEGDIDGGARVRLVMIADDPNRNGQLTLDPRQARKWKTRQAAHQWNADQHKKFTWDGRFTCINLAQLNLAIHY